MWFAWPGVLSPILSLLVHVHSSCAVLICLFHDFTGYSFGGALDTFGVGGCCRPVLQSRLRGVCIWPVR